MAKNKYGAPTDDLDEIFRKQQEAEKGETTDAEENDLSAPVGTEAVADDTINPTGELPDAPYISETIEPLNEVPTEEAIPEEVQQEVDSFITGMIQKTEEIAATVEDTSAFIYSENKPTGGNKMANYYVPKKVMGEKTITKKDIKKIDFKKIDSELEAELTGTGASKISGSIDVHVSADQFKDAIIKIIKKMEEKVEVPNKKIFGNFIENIVGISSQLAYDMNNSPMTVATFHKEAVNKIMFAQPTMNVQVASNEATAVVTGYVGKSVTELKNAANSLAVRLLTLVVKKDAIPMAEGKHDKFAVDVICNPFTSEYVKSVMADNDYLYIGVNLASMFKFVQGHFTAEELKDITTVSATIIQNSAAVSSVVYRVEKKQ